MVARTVLGATFVLASIGMLPVAVLADEIDVAEPDWAWPLWSLAGFNLLFIRSERRLYLRS